MGTALARTNRMCIGTGVTCPILWYNPAVIAQVFATLGFMFHNRVILGMGRGESLNEIPSGNRWPPSQERFDMLKEALYLIRKLWNESWVRFKGDYYWVKDSILYTKPKVPIPIYIAGLGPQSSKLAGEQLDGFITNELNVDIIKNKLLRALKEGATKAGKDYDSLEKVLFIPGSYNKDKNKAIESMSYWKGAMIKAFFDVDVHDPRKIEENGEVVGNDVIEKTALVFSNAEEAIQKIRKYTRFGFTEIVVTNSSPHRYDLIKLLAEVVAPYV